MPYVNDDEWQRIQIKVDALYDRMLQLTAQSERVRAGGLVPRIQPVDLLIPWAVGFVVQYYLYPKTYAPVVLGQAIAFIYVWLTWGRR